MPLAFALAACAGPALPPTPPPDPSAGPARETLAPPAAASPATSATAPASALAPAEPAAIRAEGTLPLGLAALTADEEKEADFTCKRLQNRLDRAMHEDRRHMRSDEYLREVLADPPKIPGMDVARCGALLLRREEVAAAAAAEAEALKNLPRIAAGFGRAFEARGGKLCPSAPPVPARLEELGAGMRTPAPDDFAAEGWACAGFSPITPLRFQYEIVTDPGAGAFEVVARGFPVPGERSVELYVRGRVQAGAPPSWGDVLRR